MSLPSAWDELTVDDFPEGGLRTLAEELGAPAAVAVWRSLRGTRLEVPSKFTQGYMLKYIRANWNGHNEGQLARVLNVTARTIRKLAGVRGKAPRPVPPEQLTFI